MADELFRLLQAVNPTEDFLLGVGDLDADRSGPKIARIRLVSGFSVRIRSFDNLPAR
jgi:hypothetical protein